jgi:hypothetical protein
MKGGGFSNHRGEKGNGYSMNCKRGHLAEIFHILEKIPIFFGKNSGIAGRKIFRFIFLVRKNVFTKNISQSIYRTAQNFSLT